MHIGELNQRVTLQVAVVSRDASYGQNLKTWNTLAEVWAAVNPTTGTRYTDADQEVVDVRYVVQIRYRDDVSPANRVLWRGKVLKIDNVINPDGRNLVLILNCSETE